MLKLITISANSGAGKDGLVGRILKNLPNFISSKSLVTRDLEERDTTSVKEYIHVTEEDFKKKIQENYFLEWKLVHEGYYYGTPRFCLEEAHKLQKDLLMEVNINGAVDVLQQKLDYGFSSQGFFLWRKFDPLSDRIKGVPFLEAIKENIESRNPNIPRDQLQKRIRSATEEYSIVKKNKHLFKFIENVEGDQDAAFYKFKELFVPSIL
jgi:guanylate kinase